MINQRFLRRPEVEARTGLSRGTIYQKTCKEASQGQDLAPVDEDHRG